MPRTNVRTPDYGIRYCVTSRTTGVLNLRYAPRHHRLTDEEIDALVEDDMATDYPPCTVVPTLWFPEYLK